MFNVFVLFEIFSVVSFVGQLCGCDCVDILLAGWLSTWGMAVHTAAAMVSLLGSYFVLSIFLPGVLGTIWD